MLPLGFHPFLNLPGQWLAAIAQCLGIALVVCRVMHYLTIATNPANTLPRAVGMTGTLVVYLVAACWLLVASF